MRNLLTYSSFLRLMWQYLSHDPKADMRPEWEWGKIFNESPKQNTAQEYMGLTMTKKANFVGSDEG